MSAVIELKEVSKHFSGHSVLDGVSLSVEAGNTVGIVGSKQFAVFSVLTAGAFGYGAKSWEREGISLIMWVC